MISRCTRSFALSLNFVLLATVLSACSSSSSSTSTETLVSMYATPSPSVAPAQDVGAKTFDTAENHEVTLDKAYLVIASTTIETSCSTGFSAGLGDVFTGDMFSKLVDIVIPVADAHTTATPTSTGLPNVIDLLDADGGLTSIGDLSPSPADYCGVTVDMLAADADTGALPTGSGEPDMVGRTLYIEASYTLSDGMTTGSFVIDTGATLIPRSLMLSALMMISADNPNGAVEIGINYDTWFDAVDLEALETETRVSTDPNAPEVSKVLQNITASMHHI